MNPENDQNSPSVDSAAAAAASATEQAQNQAQQFMFKMLIIDAIRGAGFPSPETASLAVQSGLAMYEESRILMPKSDAPLIGKDHTGAGAPFKWQMRALMLLSSEALQDLYITVKEGQIKYAAVLREAAQAPTH